MTEQLTMSDLPPADPDDLAIYRSLDTAELLRQRCGLVEAMRGWQGNLPMNQAQLRRHLAACEQVIVERRRQR